MCGAVVLAGASASACSNGDDDRRAASERPSSRVEGTQQSAPTTWDEQPYPECGELPTRVVTTVAGDLDGDASDDMLVGVRCETVTAGAPNVVVAFLVDATSGEVASREVLVAECGDLAPCQPGVRDEHLVGDLDLGIVDGTVAVAGKGYSPDAPLCCPDLEHDLRFRWTGERFDQVPRGR